LNVHAWLKPGTGSVPWRRVAATCLALALSGAYGGPELAAQEATYRVYVGAESSDFLHRVAFGPTGARVEASVHVASLYEQSGVPDLLTESEGPHGVAIDGRRGMVYMTTGHGLPEGKLWKIEAGTGRLLADPVPLGRFPASLGLSPDGRWVYVANFNLHGTMAPSSISVVQADQMVEVARIETCTMPHGSRVHPDGLRHYSACMMDDQLVEIDATELAVSRRLYLGSGEERPLARDDLGFHAPPADGDAHHGGHAHADHAVAGGAGHYQASCSPTWVQPDHAGERLYVACNRSDQVLEVDIATWKVLRRFDTGRGPYNVDITADDRLLVVTLKQGDGVEFIEIATGERAALEATSTRVVHGIALSPDSRYAFISVEGIGAEPGKVDIFDLGDFTLAASVPVAFQASGIAFWEMSER